MTDAPLIGSVGLWYAYLAPQIYSGDGNEYQLDLVNAGSLGNTSLFTEAPNGVALTHRSVVHVDVHGSCEHEVAIERTLEVQLDKGSSGGLMPRGQSIFVAGEGNAFYIGLLEAGHIIRVAVSAPGDQVEITGGYISVSAIPV